MKNLYIAFIIATLSLTKFSVAEETMLPDIIIRKQLDPKILERLRLPPDLNGESIRVYKQSSLLDSLLKIQKVQASIELNTIMLHEKIPGSNGSALSDSYKMTPLYQMEQIKTADGKSNAVYLRAANSHETDPKLTLLNGKLYAGNVKLNEAGEVINIPAQNTKTPLLAQGPVYTVIGNKVYVGDAVKNSEGKVVDPKTKQPSLEIADLTPHLDTSMVRKARGEEGVKAEREESILLAMTRAGLMGSYLIKRISRIVKLDNQSSSKYSKYLEKFHTYDSLLEDSRKEAESSGSLDDVINRLLEKRRSQKERDHSRWLNKAGINGGGI